VVGLLAILVVGLESRVGGWRIWKRESNFVLREGGLYTVGRGCWAVSVKGRIYAVSGLPRHRNSLPGFGARDKGWDFCNTL
jgi:hypothetical protein